MVTRPGDDEIPEAPTAGYATLPRNRPDIPAELSTRPHVPRIAASAAGPGAAAGSPDDKMPRIWSMPKASADRLAALVDDVHFATRLPKHLIMGALVNVVDRHRDEVEAEAREAGGTA